MPRKHVVIIEGLIGCGKSSLATELASALGDQTLCLLEPDERDNANPFLARYYPDDDSKRRWGYTMQTRLLALRFRMQLLAQDHATHGTGHAVLDRSYYGDTCFARMLAKNGLMLPEEFETYQMLYHEMTKFVLLPSVCVRILVSPSTANARIRRRAEARDGRKCETVIDADYLHALDNEIGYMVGVLRQQGVLILDIPWDAERDTPQQRDVTVRALAERILNYNPPDLFLDLHRRTV